MHCPWTRKTRAWGYEVIRGIDEDDPLRVIRAFRHPIGLSFVDLNTQVEIDYGGYAWTQWMHGHFGDTALHIALKWKRHQAVKALLSLRPNWTIPNEAGVTAEQIALRIYGKDMITCKGEQEREYEHEAMRAEDEAMRRLMITEQATRDSARLKFLQELHAARTLGIEREAAILFEHGRVVLADEVSFPGERCNKRCRRRPSAPLESDPACPDERANHVPATTDGGSDGDRDRANNKAKDRWVSHVCRELRRNRFAAQRGAMRRNVMPSRAPSSAGAARTLSLSPARTTTESVGRSRTDTESKAKAARSLRSPTGAANPRISREGRKRLTRQPQTAQTDASSGQQQHEEQKQQVEDGNDGHMSLFDSSSTVGSERRPYARNSAKPSGVKPGRGRSTSPLRSASPDGGGFSSQSARGAAGNSVVSSPASFDGAASIRSGSAWGGGKASTSPRRFDRSSRMSTMRTTRILAAGKSLQRLTPEGRLQRKMATRSVAWTLRRHAPATVAAAAGLGKTSPRSNALGSTPSRSSVLLAPAVVLARHRDGESDASGAATVAGNSNNCAIGRGTGVTPCRNIGAVQAPDMPVPHGGAIATAETSGGEIGATSRHGGGVAQDQEACINAGSTTPGIGLKMSPGNGDLQDDGNFGCTGPTAESSSKLKNTGKSEAVQRERNHQGKGCSSVSFSATKPHQSQSHSSTKPDDRAEDDDRSRFPLTPRREDVQKVLGGVRQGPGRDLLAALLASTVMSENGDRVPAPSFPSISSLRELKYCGPVEPPYASALGRAVFIRPGVLIRLSLPGKRIGDEGATALATALPSIQIVDLRSNNIGDAGTIAIASALCQEVAAAEVAATVTTATLLDGQGPAGERRRNGSSSILESLCLAGNRIEDAGATALSDMLEDGVASGKLVETKRQDGSRVLPSSSERLRCLGWLSVAGNPGISDDARRRLLRVGSNCRVMRSSGGREKHPLSMMIIA